MGNGELAEAQPAMTGHLYIVKNRLPPQYEKEPVSPHLTEEEVRGECEKGEGPTPDDVHAFDQEAWGDMTTDQLGSFCCCDCMHTNGMGNFGPKFPHGSFANFMYMTPMWCNSLARLAYEVSEEAVNAATSPTGWRADWEQAIDASERR